MLAFMLYSTVAGIPWSYYYHFVLEEKHGFNKQVGGEAAELQENGPRALSDQSFLHQRCGQEVPAVGGLGAADCLSPDQDHSDRWRLLLRLRLAVHDGDVTGKWNSSPIPRPRQSSRL